jgi:hypothetical protein
MPFYYLVEKICYNWQIVKLVGSVQVIGFVMTSPVYKLFFFKYNARSLELSPDEQQELVAKTKAPAAQLGVRTLITASTRWSNERSEYFGIELYPSLEIQQQYTRCLEESGWFRYVDGESYLGIPMDSTANGLNPPEIPPADENTVYRVYLSRLTDFGHSLAPDQLNEVWALGREALHRANGKMLISGYVRWDNEEWESFGVESFPNHKAVLSYSQFLSISGWYRVSTARSFLGTAVGGDLSGK